MYGVGCASTGLSRGGGEHAAWGQVGVQLVTRRGQVGGAEGRGLWGAGRGGEAWPGSVRGPRGSARVPPASCPDGHRGPVHT